MRVMERGWEGFLRIEFDGSTVRVSQRRFSDLWLVLRGESEIRKREKNISTWPSWMLARHMTVRGERDSGVR